MTSNSSDTPDVRTLAEESSTFCIYPFSHIATKTDGSIKLCCRSNPISNVSKESVLDVWNGEKYKEVRRKLLTGQRPVECEECWEAEDVGSRSMRQRALNRSSKSSRWNRYNSLLATSSVNGSVSHLPRSIELKLSNLCNLKCRMCHPVDSTLWAKEWPLVSDLMKEHNQWTYKAAERHNVVKTPVISAFEDNERWWAEFDKMADCIDLIEFAGGEPLIDSLHYRILDRLLPRAGAIRLKYSTNLTKLEFRGKPVFDYWKNFASVSVYASLDGIHSVYEYIRTGANFDSVVNNLSKILNSREVNFDEIAVACTIQAYNVFQLPEIADFFTRMGVQFHTHRVNYPAFLCVQILPKEMKERATELVLNYQNKIKAEGMDERLQIHLGKHFQDHLNHMNGRDQTHLLPTFREYTRRLDKSRETDVCVAVPELRPLFEPLESSLPTHLNKSLANPENSRDRLP